MIYVPIVYYASKYCTHSVFLGIYSRRGHKWKNGEWGSGVFVRNRSGLEMFFDCLQLALLPIHLLPIITFSSIPRGKKIE